MKDNRLQLKYVRGKSGHYKNGCQRKAGGRKATESATENRP